MIFDQEESPLFDKIEVQGCLQFKNGQDLHLKARKMFITGEFSIGTSAAPFKNKAQVTIIGARNDEAIAIEDGWEAGNKVIANIGRLLMYG